ncbi:hypothetical protein [Actinoplanes awajinensis]|uniref:Uncharacterized protein n=1 Tax=Actinoplanes awajinensis subsp. mycoplanecinus TaxID=135947 RepID=A0A101JIP2_9ACTN|nr:hypothetical protein [Actinoplanes awajinensis]KUL27529.1 hypothetical protein ADL15_35110 [Actinoplanes awajinensis subsp. mycoplanecinus]
MVAVRSLREIFGELAGAGEHTGADPAALLARSGHPDLPEELVAQAVSGFAETARPEIAEHLSAYVMAHSPIPGPGGEAFVSWVDLLATAPTDDFGLDFGAGADHADHADHEAVTATDHDVSDAEDWAPAELDDFGVHAPIWLEAPETDDADADTDVDADPEDLFD